MVCEVEKCEVPAKSLSGSLSGGYWCQGIVDGSRDVCACLGSFRSAWGRRSQCMRWSPIRDKFGFLGTIQQNPSQADPWKCNVCILGEEGHAMDCTGEGRSHTEVG